MYQAMEVEITSPSGFFLDFYKQSTIPTTDFLNNTNSSHPIRDEKLVKIEIAVLGTCFSLAIINNLCVLLVLLWRRKKIRRMQLFILHLSIADLIVAFFNILPQLIWDITFRFMAGDGMCRFIKYAQMFSLYLSTYILIMTAVDRYRAICHPLSNQTWTPCMVYCKIFIAYAIATIFSIPQAILFQMQEVNKGSGIYDCWVHFEPAWVLTAYALYIFFALYLIPILILLFTYGSICYTIWTKYRHAIKAKRDANMHLQRRVNKGVILRTHTVRGFSKAKLNSVKLTFAVIVTYIICWSPFFVSQIWWLFDETVVGNAGVVVILLMACLNSCTNPWIYLIFNRNYISNVLRCKKWHRHRVKAAATTETERLSLASVSRDSRRTSDSKRISESRRISDARKISNSTQKNNSSSPRKTSDQFTYSDKTTML
uniref:G-protein coupled receptors family 1 profile domain-containing protein n=2 Tax=Octopus bimaculoides TaxID=37653 RepID=A0A0L8I8U1_OCTBM